MYNHQLDTFLCVADAGSFSKAAEALYVSPTAVMKQINLLEDALEVQLFVCTPRGCAAMELNRQPLCCAMSIYHPLTQKDILKVEDLYGQRLMLMKRDWSEYLDAALFELIPSQPYSEEDLNWRDEGSRVNAEHEDETLRDIALERTAPDNWESYDTVFVGYPIWWGSAAWPVNNFVKNNDFTGKTVIPFCTSSSSGLGESGALLAQMAGTGDWQEGKCFSSSVSDADVIEWLDGLGL